jgi:DNA-cytosine methyltransferase
MSREVRNVLSLFDGMSCGQQALERAGIKYNKYYASEIDKYAIKVTQHNYPNTIQLGSVTEVDVADLEPIDLLIGGSPCQSFSFVGKRNGMTTSCNEEIYTLERYLELKADGFQFEGESYLFWEYMRILTDIRKYNPDVLFLLENVEMGAKWERVLSEAIGIYGVHINSALVSAQNRKRIYWTNIRVREEGLFGELHSDIPQPEDRGILLKDILEDDVDEKYYLSDKMLNYFNGNSKKMKDAGNGFSFSPTIGDKKAKAVTTKCGGRMDDEYIIVIPEATAKSYVEIEPGECFDAENVNSKTRRGRKMVNKSNCLMAKKTDFMHYSQNARIRRLTPIECERLQTVEDNYTSCVSDTQRYKMLGNGWTVEVIKHIFSFI